MTVTDVVNVPPIVNNDADSTNEDTPVTTIVISNDSDSDGNLDNATLAILSNGSNGTAVVNGDGTVTYMPNADFSGVDTYSYEICDDGSPLPSQCGEATVTITVNPINDAPIASDDCDETDEDTAVTTVDLQQKARQKVKRHI